MLPKTHYHSHGIKGHRKFDKEKYLKARAEKELCPFCSSENIYFSNPSLEGNTIYQEADCDDCTGEWRDKYKLMDVVEINA